MFELNKLNKAFENRIRLGIMSMLCGTDYVDFLQMKSLLQVTDGNLSSHLKGLEKEEYVKATKQFIGLKPNTSYQVTEKGRIAFLEHLNALEELLKSNK